MTRAYLSLGANLGDAEGTLREAARRLAAAPGVAAPRLSPLYSTAPQGLTAQPRFINAVLALETTLGARELLGLCQAVETALGRTRTLHWGPRTIDVDLLLHGGLRLDEPGLLLPHPRMLERAFVLRPLLDLEPGLVVFGISLQEALDRLPDQDLRPLAPRA